MGRWLSLFAGKPFTFKEPTQYDRTFTEQGEVTVGVYAKTGITGYERGAGLDYKGVAERKEEAAAKKKRIEDEFLFGRR